MSKPIKESASNYGCHQWTEHELSGILDRGETKEQACRSLTSSVNKLWLGGPAQTLRLDRDVPVLGCQDCDCCKPAFNSWFACMELTQQQNNLINQGGYD